MDKTSRYIFFGVGTLLLIAIFPLPFDYYVTLRGLVSIAAVLLFISALKRRAFGWLLIAIPSFLLWFPMFGVQLEKSEWVYLDLMFGVLYLVAGFALKITERRETQ